MLTDEQRFLFDLKGWLLLPGLLSETEVSAVRAQMLETGNTHSSVMAKSFTGPAAELLDHPAVVAVLEEILSDMKPPEDFYDFRCEDSFFSQRSIGFVPGATKVPHVVIPPRRGGPMTYQCRNGRIYAGLTRVVWELNEVKRGCGGTQFVSGTHKSDFPYPDSVRVPDNPLLETYACPAGSALIFTESLLHATTAWTDSERQRLTIFTAYNSPWAQWYRMNIDQPLVEAMPPKRRSLFRVVYAHDFKPDSATKGYNREYSAANHTL